MAESIYKKMLEVQKNLEPVTKKGFNSFHKYKYVQESDILREINPLLQEQGLFHYCTQLQANIDESCAAVEMQLIILDTETKEEVRATGWGYAQDKKGDKALYKAITGATKYLYMKFFGIASTEDPERDSGEEERHIPDKKQEILERLRAYYLHNRLKPEDFSGATGIDINAVSGIQDINILNAAQKDLQRWLENRAASPVSA